MNKGVVLVSGGMDSLVSAAIAVKECNEVFFLHINYGQRTEIRELDAFQKIVAHYSPQGTLICNMDYLREIGFSSLTDSSIKMDDPEYLQAKEHKMAAVPNTYVPFRNGLMLSVAASWAETLSAGRVYIGAVEEDGSGYPDCRQTFFDAFTRAIASGTKNAASISIHTPLIKLSKKEIVLLGSELAVPFEHSWSCYKNNETACGVCTSCYLRIRAFADAGVTDPIEYEDKRHF